VTGADDAVGEITGDARVFGGHHDLAVAVGSVALEHYLGGADTECHVSTVGWYTYKAFDSVFA